MNRKTVSLMGGVSLGAIAMYLLDPQHGKDRRTKLTQAAGDALHGAGDALGKAWEDLSEKAGELGRHLSEHASDLADKAGEVRQQAHDGAQAVAEGVESHFSGLGDRLLEQARRVGQSVRERASAYTSRASRAAADVADFDYQGAARRYAEMAKDYARGHYEPEPEGHSGTAITLTAAGAVGLGLGAYFLLEPTNGAQRREMLMSTVNRAVGEAGSAFRTTGQFIRGQFERMGAEVVGLPNQEGSERIGGHWGSLRWNNTTRLGLGIAGGTLGFYGAVRRDWIGLGAGTLGLGLMAAGLANYDFSQLGKTARRFKDVAANLVSQEPISIRRQMDINAPVARVFEFWSDYRNFPQIMSDVIEVRDVGNGKSHWTVKGPAGVPVSWEANITQIVINDVLSWESAPESIIYNTGRITFRDDGAGKTHVDIELAYVPPAGAMGHAVARLFGADPESDMDRDLAKVKSKLETASGQPAAYGM